MGIYIKRMEMPENCIECPLRKSTVCDAFQLIQPYTFKDDERAAFCPLTEVPEPKTGWIPVSERLPKCEQEVLICTEKKLVGRDAYIDSIVTPAIYEDGTMLEVESMWSWYDMVFDEWDDAEDCGIIPMGWFENRHFNPDEVYNNPVDRKVVAWMPLPEPYREEDET